MEEKGGSEVLHSCDFRQPCRLSLGVPPPLNLRDLGLENRVGGKVVHPIITLLRTATGATSLPHRRRQKSGQWAAPHRRRSLSSRQFSPARFHSAPIDRCTRSILFPSRCTTTRCNRAYCGIVNFVPALKGDSGCSARRAVREQRRGSCYAARDIGAARCSI